MTLCLAESLARTDRAVNALDQIRRYIQWYRCGHLSSTGDCFDVGATTRIALEIWEEHFELVGYASDGGLGKADNRSEIVKEEEEEVFVRGQKKIDDALKRKVSNLILAPIAQLVVFSMSSTLLFIINSRIVFFKRKKKEPIVSISPQQKSDSNLLILNSILKCSSLSVVIS